MRILFVATGFSPLAARWIDQTVDQGWDIHVYDVANKGIHPIFRNVTVYGESQSSKQPLNPQYEYVRTIRCKYPFKRGYQRIHKVLPSLASFCFPTKAQQLAQIIKHIRPNIIHTLKMQSEAITLFEAKQVLGGLPCPWVYSVWGSDIILHAKSHSSETLREIQQVLREIDYLMADNPRDITLALENGFSGQVLGVFPTGGGYPVSDMQEKVSQPASRRRVIAVKGYQNEWAGQAIIALEALKRCGEKLAGYEVIVHSAIDTYASAYYHQVYTKAKELENHCQVKVTFLPFGPPENIWELFSQSRLALAISKSDGTPNAMLEAMIMGAYPIQSDTGGLEHWIESGSNGHLVPYDDIGQISQAIIAALTDDDLVDRAGEHNMLLARQRLERSAIQSEVIGIYQRVCSAKLQKLS